MIHDLKWNLRCLLLLIHQANLKNEDQGKEKAKPSQDLIGTWLMCVFE